MATRYLSVLVQMWVIRSANSMVPSGPRNVPVSFWLLYPQNLTPTVSTWKSGFERASVARQSAKADAGSSAVTVMVTCPVIPSGPLRDNATSPCPGSLVQASGTGSVILGAAGSATWATVPMPIPAGPGKQTNALGGMCSGNVVSIPGTGVRLPCVG